jgi:tRNA nucleotidyltransferase (CCA-adding enzyme)
MALLSTLKDEERNTAIERLSPPPRVGEMITKGIAQSKDILNKLPLNNPVSLYHLLNGVNLEVLLFSMAQSKNKQKQKAISQYLIELRKIKPILKGNDLQKIGIKPGPVYSKLLSELLDEKLSGRLKNKEDEERFIREKHLI